MDFSGGERGDKGMPQPLKMDQVKKGLFPPPLTPLPEVAPPHAPRSGSGLKGQGTVFP